MPRELPEKPNLEYLKKQAKQLQRTMPKSKLADAQHALANEYGYATWAKLKSRRSAELGPGTNLKGGRVRRRRGSRARDPGWSPGTA